MSVGADPGHTPVDVAIRSGRLTLRGTLTVPAGAGPFPAALLVVGSGPVDRNSDHRKLPLGVTRLLAEALATAGVASLRFDKRGVGASEGDYWSAGLHDNIADARAALSVLRAHDAVADGAVLVVGHSEGAFIATALGADEPVTGVGLLSASVRTGEEVLRWQAGEVAGTLPTPVRALLGALRIDLRVRQAKVFDRLRSSDADTMRVSLQRMNAKWMREFLDFDPRPLLHRIDAPVIAVTGGADVQTPPADVDAIGAAVAGPFEGHVVEGVSHLLRDAGSRPGPRDYKRQAGLPLNGRVVTLVTSWAAEVTAGHTER